MSTQTVQDLKDKLAKYKNIMRWEEISPNVVYHIPPIVNVERKDILVLSKNDENIEYRKIGDASQTKRTMHKTSICAKFIVKRKVY